MCEWQINWVILNSFENRKRKGILEKLAGKLPIKCWRQGLLG